MFWYTLILCLGGSILAAACVTGIVNWWEKHPLKEEKERPFYITRPNDNRRNYD